MNAIKHEASKIGGTAWVNSKLGKGAEVIIEVPLLETPYFDIMNLRTSA